MLLALMMLLSCFTPVLAADPDEDDSGLEEEEPGAGGDETSKDEGPKFENLWETAKVGGFFDYNDCTGFRTGGGWESWASSIAIEVEAGQVITFGPANLDWTGYIGVVYAKSTGKYLGKPRVSKADGACVEEGQITSNGKIISYTVPAKAKYLRLSVPSCLADCMLVTRDYVFTAEEYYEYMSPYFDTSDTPVQEVVNIFEGAQEGYFEGEIKADANYRCKVYNVGTDVAVGDVLYFTAPVSPDKAPIYSVYQNDEKSSTGANKIPICEEIGGGYAIYAYKVTEHEKQVALILPADKYAAGEIVVTKNQPLTGGSYRKAVGIEIENLYDVTKSEYGHVSTAAMPGLANSGAWGPYWTSNPIEVQVGDTITFGPYYGETRNADNPYTAVLYEADGTYVGDSAIYVNPTFSKFNCVEVDTIFGSAKIYTYTVTKSSAKYIRITTIAPYANCTLITKNLVFSAEEYFDYMDANGVNVDFLRPTNTEDELNNLFAPGTAEVKPGYRGTSDTLTDADHYRHRMFTVGVDVEVGDTLYFTARTDSGYYPLTVKFQTNYFQRVYPYKANLNGYSQMAMHAYEDLGNGYAIYAYQIGPNVKDLCILLPTSKYNAGELMVTKNQPFTSEALLDSYKISEEIEVEAGDKITVGMVQKESWFIRPLTTNATTGKKVYGDKINGSSIRVSNEVILGDAKIYTYTVPQGVTSLHVVYSEFVEGCVKIAKNDVFTADEYFAEMASKGLDLGYLEYKDTAGDLTNLFPRDDVNTLRGYVSKGEFTGNYYSRSRVYEVGEGATLQAGDTLYIAPVSKTRETAISVTLTDGTSYNLSSKQLILFEDIGREYGIYLYHIEANVAEVAVVLGTGDYDMDIVLVTKNQPFTGEHYREIYGIDLNDWGLDEESPLNGLDALFIGDSISRGGHDYISYLDHSKDSALRLAWAGGLAAHTGLNSVNASVSGARISYHDDSDNPGHWIYTQMEKHYGEHFDFIVMHGGVNDCPDGRYVLGTPLPVTATEEEITAMVQTKSQDPAGKKTSFALGLQYTIMMARKNFPDAKLFYVANAQIKASDRNVPLKKFLDMARTICEMYDVYYIDLYNNEQLTEEFQSENTFINLDDSLHPNRAGYDVLEPYIKAPLEAEMCNEATHKFTIDNSSATDHWTTCRYCGAENGRDAHVYDNDCDTTCNLESCGYVRTVEPHNFSSTGMTTSEHWKACTSCGLEEAGSRKTHTFDNACDRECNDGCGYARTITHDFSVVDKNATQHFKKCSICGVPDETSYVDHYYTDPCDAVCDGEGCGFERIPPHDYTVANKDADYHWIECSICHEVDASTKVEHVYDNACDTICNDETCGYEREITHDFSVTDKNETQHWTKCSVCGLEQEGSRKDHVYDDANDVECDCGYLKCTEHDFSIIDKDGERHWKECSICGSVDVESIAVHEYSKTETNETQHWKVCAVCSLVEENSAKSHVYEYVCDAACDCGYTRTIVHDYCVKGSDATHHWEACLLCGAVDETAKETHVFGEWVVTGDTRTRSCACGYSESEKIPVATPDDTTDVPGSDTPVDPGDDTTAPDGDDTTADLGDDTTEPDDDDTTADVVTDGDGTDADTDDEDSGCGSVIGGATALVALALILPAAAAVRKKDEE